MGKRYARAALGALVIATVAVVAVVLVGMPGKGDPSTVVRPQVATPVTTSTPAPSPTIAPAAAVTPVPTVTSTVSPSPAPTPTASPTPTPEPGGPVLPYNSFDTTGTAATAGSYSVLMPDDDSDDDDAMTAVTTYEQLRTEGTTLVLNETDGDGFDQSAALDAVRVDDVIEWNQTRDCWTRYKVMSTPEPAEGSTVRSFGVKWHMYSFVGCSGAVDASAATQSNLDPGPQRITGHPEPIRYGPWQLVAYGWTGSYETLDSTDDTGIYPTSSDIATVKRHRLWRDPAGLPSGWVLQWVDQGFENIDGYIAYYGDGSIGGVEIQIRELHVRPYTRRLDNNRRISLNETRDIDGLVAYVAYDSGEPLAPTLLRAFNPSTNIEYLLVGFGLDLPQVITIARSLWASE